ncbi:hypothetical protein ANO11243_024600 [Dothideomycetidae sp. 11243]|nr:hypothetical protein ANO11243_024600 [fungal sp. No.11243]
MSVLTARAFGLAIMSALGFVDHMAAQHDREYARRSAPRVLSPLASVVLGADALGVLVNVTGSSLQQSKPSEYSACPVLFGAEAVGAIGVKRAGPFRMDGNGNALLYLHQMTTITAS